MSVGACSRRNLRGASLPYLLISSGVSIFRKLYLATRTEEHTLHSQSQSGVHGASMWPLWIETKEGVRRVDLEPGDGVLFRGIDQRHWREPFGRTASVQVLLHYVEKEGPYSLWLYDGRPRLSMLSNSLPPGGSNTGNAHAPKSL